MKHIALRSKSIRKGDRPYTAPGLGDRLHGAYVAYQYGRKHNTPVTIHLTDDKWSVAGGVKSDKKKKSWAEIISLFPEGALQVQPHPVENLTEDNWLEYLKSKGYDAEIFYYKDAIKMHPNETVVPLEISEYLKTPLMLDAEKVDLELPKKFITTQWDSTDVGRTLSPIVKSQILSEYQSKGYKVLVVGGESENALLRDSLKHVAYAMSKADKHVGCDSGFFHMALMYFDFKDIVLYGKVNGYKSHHLYRAINNGCVYKEV